MKIKRTALAVVSTVSLSILSAFPALAGGYGYLSGYEPGSRVNVRSEPSVNAASYSYGVVGDYVDIHDWQQGYDGWGWYYVEFPSSGTEGWVRADFVEDHSGGDWSSSGDSYWEDETMYW